MVWVLAAAVAATLLTWWCCLLTLRRTVCAECGRRLGRRAKRYRRGEVTFAP